MNRITILDMTELKMQMKDTYKLVGLTGALQIIYELNKATEVLLEVIEEAKANDSV